MPGEAAARLGQQAVRAIGDFSQAVETANDRHQTIADDSAKNFARTRIQKALDEHQQFRIQNPDETTWESDMSERMQSAREDVMKQRMSPLAQQQMQQQLDGWQQNYVNDTKTAMLTQGKARARQRSTNAVLSYRQAGDFESARNVISESEKSGVWSPEEAEADRLDLHDEEKTYVKQEAVKTQQRAITADAAAWLESNDPKKIPEGMDPAAYDNLFSFARSKLSDDTAETVHSIQDGMASGDITDGAQIDRLGIAVRPAVREQLKQELAKRNDAQEKAFRQTDEYKNQVAGEVLAALDDYKATDNNFDERYVEMATRIDSLPQGAFRDELQRRLDAVRKGQVDEVKSYADQAKKVLGERYKLGDFGDPSASGKVGQEVRPLVNDGFLRAEAKLTGVGLSDDQAKAVSSLDEDALKRVLRGNMADTEADARAVELSKDKTDANRIKAFRMIYGMKGGQVSGTPFEQAAAQAIYEGQNSFKYETDEAKAAAYQQRIQALQSYGEAQRSLHAFLQTNPNATPQQVDQYLFEVAGDNARRALQDSKVPGETSQADPPSGSGAAAAPIGTNLRDVVMDLEAGDAPDGFHRRAYWDYHQWSIGYGTRAKGPNDTVDQAEAERRLDSELSTHRERVDKIAKANGYTFTAQQKDALTSFDFNTGKLEQLLIENGHRSNDQIADAMQLYHFAGDQPLRGLKRRRAIEAEIFRNGYRK